MPRIRSLKPDHRTHRKVGKFSDRDYRLWVSMILEADDEGRLVVDADQLRVQTWPYHPRVTREHVETAINDIAAAGRVRLYEIDGVRYGLFPKWKDHQHPKYPSLSKFPAPLAGPQQPFPQPSPNAPPTFPQDFPPRVVELRGVELDRAEGRGEESRGEGEAGSSSSKGGQEQQQNDPKPVPAHLVGCLCSSCKPKRPTMRGTR